MRRTCFLLAAAAALWVAGPCSANQNHTLMPFPALRFGASDGVGNGTWALPFYQGWFEGKPAWYILENGSNDINTNHWIYYRTLFPKLASAIGAGANPVYIVLNYQQGPVFSSMPGEDDYSSLWQIFYIEWKPGAAKRPVVSDLDLPGAGEADIIETGIVVDRPIIAVGRLSNPWYPAPAGTYRIKQAFWVDVRGKWIALPYWRAYGQDGISQSLATAFMLIPDVADPGLAALIGANYAPGLADVDAANTQRLWVQDWTTMPFPPPAQYAVLEFLPHYVGRMQDNYDFSPVMDLQMFARTGLPAYVIIKSPAFLMNQLPPTGTGMELVGNPIRVNGLLFLYYFPGGAG